MCKRVYLLGGLGECSPRKILNLDSLRLLPTQSGTRLLFNARDKTLITINNQFHGLPLYETLTRLFSFLVRGCGLGTRAPPTVCDDVICIESDIIFHTCSYKNCREAWEIYLSVWFKVMRISPPPLAAESHATFFVTYTAFLSRSRSISWNSTMSLSEPRCLVV